MHAQDWLDLIRSQASQTQLIQWAILIFGVSEVLFAMANKILLYPTGIAATMLSIFVLFKAQLFAESLLNVYYLVMSIYGWWYWSEKNSEPAVKITHANTFDWLMTGGIALGGWIILFFILKEFTPSTVPAWDAWVSSTAWAGMWLLAKRKVENWILLNLSNAFAIPLLIQKNLPLFALLTSFLFVVACFGYVSWFRIVKKDLIGNDKS